MNILYILSVNQIIKLQEQWLELVDYNALLFKNYNSARNKDQKLVGRFLKIGYFIGYYIAVPLKMYGKYGRSK